MQAVPAPVRESPILSPERHRDGTAALDRGRRALRVDCVGHLVPRFRFDALVHSVFAQACNIECDDDLLTVVHCRLADGPTTLRLAHASATDLRFLFRAGDRWCCREGIVVTRSVPLDLARAAVWRPAPLDGRNPAPELGARLRLAAATLAQWRRSHSSVIDREGGGMVVELREACRRLDVDAAGRYVAQLVGWGEGLTPAGDDLLVGLCAALGARVDGRADRAHFLLELSAAMMAQTHRTTPVAAHFLRLAARGHFNADLLHVVDALLRGRSATDLAPALLAALERGATSGADTVTGVVAGLVAWRDADDTSDSAPIAGAATSPLQ